MTGARGLKIARVPPRDPARQIRSLWWETDVGCMVTRDLALLERHVLAAGGAVDSAPATAGAFSLSLSLSQSSGGMHRNPGRPSNRSR